MPVLRKKRVQGHNYNVQNQKLPLGLRFEAPADSLMITEVLCVLLMERMHLRSKCMSTIYRHRGPRLRLTDVVVLLT